MVKQPIKTAIVGAGISGLAAAFGLSRNSQNLISIFDVAEKPGGVLQTSQHDDFLIESSADMFVSDPSAGIELCELLGIADELIPTEKTDRFSSIVRNGRLVRTPAGFSLLAPSRIGTVLTSPLLSPIGKIRFLMDYFVRPRVAAEDESLKSFTERHYGREVFDRMVQPLVAGIYSADADRLSIQATLNRFVKMESKYGSLIKAARSSSNNREQENNSSGARYSMFLTPRNGFRSVIESLVNALSNVDFQMNSQVKKIQSVEPGWELSVNDQSHHFDQVILATSAKVSSRLLYNVDQQLSERLSKINYGSMIVIAITCSKENFRNGAPRGFGFVVPEIENRKIIACSFSSNKFKGRAPNGKHLIRVFIGGSIVEEATRMTDEELQTLAVNELRDLIGFENDEKNVGFQIHRWLNCMPQYEVGHLERIESIEAAVSNHTGLQLAGSSYKGVGIPACIQSGWDAADKLIQRSSPTP